MNITFSARHFEASDKLREFALKEVNHLEKYNEDKMSGEIILEENGNLKIIDIRIMAFGKKLTSQVEGNDFYKALPKVVNKLEKQLKSAKSKITNRG